MADTPLVFVGKMWLELVDWAKRQMPMSQPPLAKAEDMAIPRCFATGDEAIAIIREHHARWQVGQQNQPGQ